MTSATLDASSTEIARAKINLFLHVRGVRAEGYHTLESFAVFPSVGDHLEAEPAGALSLAIDGPFGGALSSGADNLVIGAANALAARLDGAQGAALRLVKSLPIASGIGGGSADAAAALRLLSRLWGGEADLDEIAFSLGADAPVCLAQAPAMMGGVGERLAPAPAFPKFWLVLANPLTPLSTGQVFSALERKENPAGPRAPLAFRDLDHLVSWLAVQRNDLEAPARGLRPVIGRVLSAFVWDKTCLLARMSGSGATCFGIFKTEVDALRAADRLRGAEPGWWIAAAPVDAWDGG